MTRPLITVLMALYNGGAYLRQSLQSVLNQTYDHFEFLIVNDCSTDDSLKVIESFHDKRIKVYNNAKNLGQTPSLNLGLKKAAGDYFARIDGDDLALGQWLQSQVNAIEKYPDYSVISSYAVAIDEENKIKKVYKPPCDKEDIILRSLIAPPIHHVGSILKKRDIIEIGGYGDRYIYAADYDLWERLIRNKFRITTTPEILVAIREHSHSVSRSEHGRRDLEEVKEIAGRNIDNFVSAPFSSEKVSLFCRAHYDEGNLTAVEFNEAVDITKKVYMNLAPSLKVANKKKVQWARQRSTTIHLKRIFYFIKQKDYNAARQLCWNASREFGPFNIFTLLFGMALLGAMVLNVIPKVYHTMLKLKARLELRFQSHIRI